MIDLTKKRIIVTGGNGFLGRNVAARLFQAGCTGVHVPQRQNCDLTSVGEVAELWAGYQPEVVIHLAANVGGIGKNRRMPGRIWLDNMAMAVNVLEMSVAVNAQKIVYVGTVCSYPKVVDRMPFIEADLFSGFPEETNAPYGIAKRAIGVGLQAIHEQYGIPAAYLIPTNLYGPADNFDIDDSHVIPAMIRRFVEAVENGEDRVTLWGTGRCSREFLYADDAAAAIVRAAEVVETPDPINLGGCGEIKIEVLAHKVARHCGFDGIIEFDKTKPNGQPRRAVNGRRAKEALGWEPTTDFEDGLTATVEWYRKQRSMEATNA
jgi:GDP-L-fucose synthase